MSGWITLEVHFGAQFEAKAALSVLDRARVSDRKQGMLLLKKKGPYTIRLRLPAEQMSEAKSELERTPGVTCTPLSNQPRQTNRPKKKRKKK